MSWNACIVRVHKGSKVDSYLVHSEKFVIGRSPDCDIIVVDDLISRKHLGVLIRGGQVYLKDLGSANGSKLGKTQVPSDTVIANKTGEAIQLGNSQVRIFLEYIEKNIESKNLSEQGLETDDYENARNLLERTKEKSSKIYEEYERLLAEFKVFSKTETERRLQEAQKKTDEILRKAEAEAENKIRQAEQRGLELQEKADRELEAINNRNESLKKQLLLQTEEYGRKQMAKIKTESEELEERLHAEAKQTAEKIIEEAREKAQSEIDEAKSKILAIESEQSQQVKNILNDADSKAKHIQAESELKAETLLNQAEIKAHDLVADAEDRARKLMTDAEAKAHDLLESAEDKVTAMVREAESKSEQALSASQSKADSLIAEAETQVHTLMGEAESFAQKTTEEAKSQALTMRSAAQVESQSLISESRMKAETLIRDAELKAQTLLQEAQQQSAALLTTAEAKAKSLTSESEMASQKLMNEVQTKVKVYYDQFESHKAEELGRLQKEFNSHKQKVEADTQAEIRKFKDAYESKVRLFDEECSIRRSSLESDLRLQTDQIARQKSELKKNEETILQLQQQAQQLSDEQLQLSSKTEAAKKEASELEGKLADFRGQNNALLLEKGKIDEELRTLIHLREKESEKIEKMKSQFDGEKSRIEKEGFSLREKMISEIAKVREKETQDIQRMRMDELEKIDKLRTKALEEIVNNKAVFKVKLAEKVESLFITLYKKSGGQESLPALQGEILNLVQNAVEEQSFELSQTHEGDIRTLVTAETQKRKNSFKRVAFLAATAVVALIAFYGYQGGKISTLFLGLNTKGESAAEEYGRQQREIRDAKKFEPPQSDFIKSNYADNVLYTRNYFSTYTNPQNQELWIKTLNQLFNKEFNLEDDAIVKFVALESTLVTRLQQEKDQVNPDFAQVSIDKMRKVEKETSDQMKKLLKDSNHLRRFQSLSEKFWHDKLHERVPASN